MKLHIPYKKRGQSHGSTFALLVADTLEQAGEPWTGLDTDGLKPDFSRSFPEQVKLFSIADAPDRTLALLKAACTGTPEETRLTDFPAEYLPAFREAARTTGWYDYLTKAGTKLVAIVFSTQSEADARDVIESLQDLEKSGADIVLVHNNCHVGRETPALFAPIERAIMDRKGVKITLPALHATVVASAQKLLGRTLALTGRYPSPSLIPAGLDFLEAALYETWLRECRQAIAAAADHLVPTGAAKAVKAKFATKSESAAPAKTILAPDFD